MNSLKILLFIYFVALSAELSAHGTSCDLALAALPSDVQNMFAESSHEDFSTELFIQTYEKIIAKLEVGDLEQLLVSPFELQHPSEGIRHQEKSLLNLMGKRLREKYLIGTTKYQNILGEIQKVVSIKLEKLQETDKINISEDKNDRSVKSVHRIIKLSGEPSSISISADGKTMATVIHAKIILWDLKTGSSKQVPVNGHHILNAVFHAFKSNILAVALPYYPGIKVVEFDLNTGSLSALNTSLSEDPFIMLYSPDGNLFAQAFDNQSISIFNRITHKTELIKKVHGSRISSMAFSSDSKLLASASYGMIRVFKTDSREELIFRHTDRLANVNVVFTEDGNITYSEIHGNNYIWNLKDNTYHLIDARTESSAIAYTTDEKFFAAGTSDGSIEVFENHPKKILRYMFSTGKFVSFLQFAPITGKLISHSHRSKEIRISDFPVEE